MQVQVHSNVKKHTADFFKFLPTIFVKLKKNHMIKHLLILHNNNLSKDKKQLLNNDFNDYGRKAIQQYQVLCGNIY